VRLRPALEFTVDLFFIASAATPLGQGRRLRGLCGRLGGAADGALSMEAARRLASLGISNGQHRKVLRGLWGAQKQHHPSESPTLSIGFSSDDHRSANDDDVKGADQNRVSGQRLEHDVKSG